MSSLRSRIYGLGDVAPKTPSGALPPIPRTRREAIGWVLPAAMLSVGSPTRRQGLLTRFARSVPP
jgi:hypothetical protein